MKLFQWAMAWSLALASAAALADTKAPPPPRLVKVVVPFAVGGATDLLARYLAEKLTQRTGRTVIVENKPGASGQIGAKVVSESAPDGSALLVHTTGWPATKVFVKAPILSVPDGLEPVALLAEERYVLAGSGRAPFNSFDGFVSYAKAHPGRLNYASAGVGDSYLLMESFRNTNRLEMVAVQYRGAAQTMVALLANEVQLAFQPAGLAHKMAADGRVQMLAISGEARSPLYPGVPTFGEVGIPNGRNRWFALYTSKNTPPDVVARIHADVEAVMRLPETGRLLSELSMELALSTPAGLRQLVDRSIREYQSMADAAGVKPE